MWEKKDSNLSAYDLQSLLTAPVFFPSTAFGIRTRYTTLKVLRLNLIALSSILKRTTALIRNQLLDPTV